MVFSGKYLFGGFFIICLLFACSIQVALSEGYFQQEVNFKIRVTLNDKCHELDAFEEVEYINNSQDTLDYLIFHLWPNGYSGNKTGLAKQLMNYYGKSRMFNDSELKGSIDSLEFSVDNVGVHWNMISGQPDICKIILNAPLFPGDTILISTPFKVKIPKGVSSRLGHIGESYQISQWYPKPAVYDLTGWHQMPYLDQGEFYSEYGRFDVSIILPENYIVGSTGNLQNIEESLKLDSLAEDTTWKNKTDSGGFKFPLSSTKFKTLRYTENNVHDFAWFADKRFHVMKGKVILPETGMEVTTWIMFTNKQAKLWKEAIPYLNNAISFFSGLIGDYPYNSFTAVQSTLNAGIGMEYPGITVIGYMDDAYTLDRVIAHEIGHSWFYSALGSNERRYPFMDEGMTSSLEDRYMAEMYPGKKLWEVVLRNKKIAKFISGEIPIERIQENDWLVPARTNLEQPINLPAPKYSSSNYSLMLYNKSAMGFHYLRAYLGDSLFDSTIHEYYRLWNAKHPQPHDLQFVFENRTGKDLKWFFIDFIGTKKRLDYKIVRLENDMLLIKNNGELVSPLIISGLKSDSICFEKWIDGFEGEKWIELPKGAFSSIIIDPKHKMPELYRLNNNIDISGLLPKFDPIRPKFLFGIENTDKRTFMYIPAVNWSQLNGLMFGVYFHNGYIIPKPLEYTFFPFFSYKNPGFTGSGKVSYNFLPFDKSVRMATVTIEGSQFSVPGDQNYHKAKVGLDLFFRTKKMNNPLYHKVFGYLLTASDLNQINMLEKAKMLNYLQLGYQIEKSGVINPLKLLTSYEASKSFQKASVEFNYKYSFFGRSNGLDIRFFSGIMLKGSSTASFYNFAASGRSGRELYLYQGTHPDRFAVFPENFLSRQMTFSEGGLVSPVNQSLGYSKWLISLSLTSDLPGNVGWIAIKPFVNFLLNDHGMGIGNSSPFFFEAGLKTGIWNLFEISVPLIVSSNIRSGTNSMKDRIRFVFNLESFSKIKLNLTELVN